MRLKIPRKEKKHDRGWLAFAYHTAVLHSTDPRTQVGAVLVDPEHGVLLAKANNFPRGVQETNGRWKRPTKYTFVVHAERNVIYTAARVGIQTKGKVMYAPWLACSDCAQAIIQSGIKSVIGHKQIVDKTPDYWLKSVTAGAKMMMEAGVEVYLVDCKIGEGLAVRFNGEIWRP
jgi:dCMP deaminase